MKVRVYPKDIVCCIKFCTEGRSKNHPTKVLELFQNGNIMSFGWTRVFNYERCLVVSSQISPLILPSLIHVTTMGLSSMTKLPKFTSHRSNLHLWVPTSIIIISSSSSFVPTLSLCVLCSLERLNLTPIVIVGWSFGSV